MRVLITGGAGFIGSNLVRHVLRKADVELVTNLDLLTYAGTPRSLSDVEDDPRYRFVHGDIGDLDLACRLLGDHDAVINVAAESHNSRAVLDPLVFFRTNVMGTAALLEAARRAEVRRFHQVSTCEVYGDLDLDADTAFTEEDPYRPRTPYNASKAGADHAVRAYHHTYGLPVTISSCANNYGPYQLPEKVLPLFVTNALDGRPLPVYASSQHRREWIHVEDHCAAIWDIVNRGEPGTTYHVGTGEERTVDELADAVLALTGADPALKTTVPDRPGHDRRYLLDSSRIRALLGWQPQVALDEGLAATVAWYREHRDWWEPLRARLTVAEDRWTAAGDRAHDEGTAAGLGT